MPYRTRASRPSVSSQENHTSSTISSNPDDNDAFYPELKPLPRTHAPLASNDPSLAIPFDMSILTISHKRDMSSVKAVIVGGGITGLAIAIMMELGGMEYEILERSTGSEPEIGSSVALGPPVLRLLEQMGLLPQIEKASKIVTGLTVVDGECRRVGRVDGVDEERYGYPYRMLTRKIFHDILMDKVNKNHLHQGKLVVETLQNPNGVSCKCSDGSTYYGDIIIGADGANSLTREKMYLQLKEQGKLPEVDMDYSIYEHTAIGGVTEPLDHNLYPAIKSDTVDIQVIYTKDYPCTVSNCSLIHLVAMSTSSLRLNSYLFFEIPSNLVTCSFGTCPSPIRGSPGASAIHQSPRSNTTHTPTPKDIPCRHRHPLSLVTLQHRPPGQRRFRPLQPRVWFY